MLLHSIHLPAYILHVLALQGGLKKPEDIAEYVKRMNAMNPPANQRTERCYYFIFISNVRCIHPVVKPTITKTTSNNKTTAHAGMPLRRTTVRRVAAVRRSAFNSVVFTTLAFIT